jgi:DNA-binding IclR family transcriptional regulator
VAEQSKTVDSALTLLAALAAADDRDGSSAASLARALGLSRTAVARLLATLEAHGLARRTDRGWRAGLGLLTLAAGIEPRLRGLSRPELEGLAARFGETAVLSVRDGDEAVAVDQVVGGTGVVQIHYRTGTRHPIAVAASGRALLASGEGAAGVVVSEGELEPGVRGVAAPVVERDGRAIATVAVVAPVHRFPPDAEVIPAVAASARRISDGLGRRGPPGAPDTDSPPVPNPAPAAGLPPMSRGGRDAVLPTRG